MYLLRIVLHPRFRRPPQDPGPQNPLTIFCQVNLAILLLFLRTQVPVHNHPIPELILTLSCFLNQYLESKVRLALQMRRNFLEIRVEILLLPNLYPSGPL